MARDYDYDFDDLVEAYARLGVGPGKLVYVGSDLTRLMRFAGDGREAVLEAHLSAFRRLLGPEGTIFVPTSTTYLCNTDVAFDPDETPSKDMGVFSEYVRTRPDAVRSFHPFWSVAGIGPHAEHVLGSVSRHGYGHGSAWQKFVDLNVLAVNVGKSPHYSLSVIHHIETVMGVPYRYTKEFIHPVLRNGEVSREPFYLSVLYRDCDIQRNQNVKILDNFQRRGSLKEVKIGRGRAWSFSHAEFFRITASLFESDIYCWLDRPPEVRPYQV